MANVAVSELNQFDSVVYVPSDGDPLSQGSFTASAEPLTNRTRYLLNVINGGVPAIKRVTDITALRADTGTGDGQVRIVNANKILYIWESSKTQTDNGYSYIYSNGTGSWRAVWFTGAVVANGVVNYDINGRVAGFPRYSPIYQKIYAVGTYSGDSFFAIIWQPTVGDYLSVEVSLGQNAVEVSQLKITYVGGVYNLGLLGPRTSDPAATLGPYGVHKIMLPINAAGSSVISWEFTNDFGSTIVANVFSLKFEVYRP